MDRQKLICDSCCENKQVLWPRIKAIDIGSIQPPPVVNPEGTIIPIINRYFFIVTVDIDLTNGATIPANLFTDDNDNPLTEFKLLIPMDMSISTSTLPCKWAVCIKLPQIH